jgi:RTX calcium-binding nonapeptide repeat (4 copies)
MRLVGPRRRREETHRSIKPGLSVRFVAALLAAFVIPTVPQAVANTTVFLYEEDRFSDGFLDVTGDDLSNDIVVQLQRRDESSDSFLITDSSPIKIDDSYAGEDQRCVQLTTREVRCETPPLTGLGVSGKAGNDRIKLHLAGSHGGGIHGDAGDDRLRGGRGGDFLTGGPGADLERGGRGSDRMGSVDPFTGDIEDPGKDRFFGGRARDEIDARDEERDRRIDCGPNGKGKRDGAWADQGLDPRPISC